MAMAQNRKRELVNLIKKEILSDENSGYTDSDHSIQSSSHFLKMNGTVIKREAHDSDVDSEDQLRKILLTPEHRIKKSSKKGPVTILQDVRLTPKKRRKRRWWVRPSWILRRNKWGDSETILKELALEDCDSDRNHLRMSEDKIQELLQKIAPKIQKSDTIMREALPAKLKLPRNNPSSPNEKLRKIYPDLKGVEITAELNLSDSDEVHLFRMPKTVDPRKLKNVEIDLESQCKLKLDEKYVVTPTTKVPDPTLVVALNSRVLRFKNNIKMEKYIKSKADPNIAIPERTSVPLPDKLKKRHPLFGSDFQKKIVLSEHVEKKLDEAIENLLKRQKKSKKKKEKKTVKVDSEERPNQELFELFNLDIKKEISDDSAIGSSTSVDRGTKKEDSDASERTISSSGRKSKSKSDKNLKHETSIKKEKYISDLLHDISVEMNISKKVKTEF